MRGELDRDAYADFLAQHHAIYVALEDSGEKLRAAGVDSGIVLDELVRVPSLEADLEFLFGRERRTAIDVLDRKSTRLNSSHVKISYAVFCLKKKKIYKLMVINK